MYSIQLLLRSSILGLLAAGIAGCGYPSAPAEIFYESGGEPVQYAEPELPEPFELPEYGYETVQAITPDFHSDILEKQRQNPDSIGWLHIPDTTINEIILKNPVWETNDYYLNLNFDKQPDADGVFCADRRTQFGADGHEDLSRITALYGHSRDDDPESDLFSQLKKYREKQFAEEHPYIFFSTAEEDMVWEVFAVFDTTVYLPYIDPDLTRSEFDQMLNTVYAMSLYDYYPEIDYDEDKLLVLSTCTFSVPGHESLPDLNDYRFAVMARLVDPDEEYKEYAEFTVVKSPTGPDSTLPKS